MPQLRYLFAFILLFTSSLSYAQTLDTLVNVGNHSLHFSIMKGEGTPILFEAGNGDDGSTWQPLLQAIHYQTGATLITYDRAGLGKSSIDTTSISFRQEIADLNIGLATLGYTRNFVVVAHSFGSMYVSEFAQWNGGDIKGAIFIDVSSPCSLTEEYATRVKNTLKGEMWGMLKQYRRGLYHVLQRFPDIAAYMSDRYLPTSIPMTVIVAERYKPTQQIGETEQDMLNWQACLKDLGNQPNHTYVTTKDTDHKVWENAPEVVIKEIVDLYKRTAGN